MKKILMNPSRCLMLFFCIIFMLSSTVASAQAQTVTIPDTAFRQYLLEKYPSVLDNQQRLITARAITVTSMNLETYPITNLSGIEYFTHLSFLYLGRVNRFSSLPDFDFITSDKYPNGDFINHFTFQIEGTDVTAFPKMPANLIYIGLYNNSKISDFSGITYPENLRSMNLQSSGLDKVPDLKRFTNLQSFVFNSNGKAINPVFDFSHNQQLEFLSISNNAVSMPDLSGLTNLGSVFLSYNKFTFKDLLLAKSWHNNFYYAPQDSIGTAMALDYVSGSSYTINLDIDDTVTNNVYKWYRNGTLVATLSQNIYTTTLPGVYTCEITNAKLPDLTLHSRQVFIESNFVIPDPGFRQFLLESFPEVLDANQKLIPSAASRVTKTMWCHDRDVKDISGIQYFKLLNFLNVSGTNITSLPALPATIETLVLEDNKLVSLEGIQNPALINYLRIGGNPTMAIPDLISFTGLTHFSCRNNKWDHMPELYAAPQYSSGVNIDCPDNNFTALPVNHSAFPVTIALNANRFTFGTLLQAKYYRMEYAPQQPVGKEQTVRLSNGESYTIDLDIDDTVTSNIYKWYRDEELVTTTTGNTYTTTVFGIYQALITNPNLPDLTLSSYYTRLETDQLVEIPDTAFRNLLIKKYPQVMDASQKLIVARAAALGELVFRGNSNIKSIQGIEYFVNLTLLGASGGGLEKVPDLSNNIKLKYLNLSNNPLPNLPDLSALKELLSLQARSVGQKLYIVDSANIYKTSLAQSPDLSKNTKLSNLELDYNSLTSLPDLTFCPDLKHLWCQNNNLTTLGELSSHKLSVLAISNNPITALPPLTTALGVLIFENCQISSLPDLSGFSRLALLDGIGNKLTFEDMLKLNDAPRVTMSAPGFSFSIQNQAKVGIADTVSVSPGSNYTIDLGIDKDIPDNVYKWYKDGQLIGTTNFNYYTINNAKAGDAGVYECQITNPRFIWDDNYEKTSAILYSNPVTIKVSPWKPVIAGENNHIIIFPGDMGSSINGSSIQPGDYIGIFFKTVALPGYACGGYIQWTGSSTSLSAYGNTSATDANGFREEEPFVFKVWKSNEQREYTMAATYDTSPQFALGRYEANLLSKVQSFYTPKDVICVTQDVKLYKGWNLVSLRVAPSDLSMAVIFDTLSQVTVKNAAGKILYAPKNHIITGKWNMMEGYLVYVTQKETLRVCGNPVTLDTTITLPANTYPYFLAYHPATEKPVASMLRFVENNMLYAQSMEYTPSTSSILAYNYIPSHVINPPINQIGNMKPGLAYKLMVTSPVSFNYNTATNARMSAAADIDAMLIPQHFIHPSNTTGNNSILLVSNETVGELLYEGDEIGVFAPDGTLAGSGVYQGTHMAITVWENSSMKPGESYIIKVWHKTQDTEAEFPLEYSKGDGSFSANSLQVAGAPRVNSVSKGSNVSHTSYPNPASDEVNITFGTGRADEPIQIVLHNSLGQAVLSRTVKSVAGKNTLQLDVSDIQGGIYSYSIYVGDKVMIGKLVIE